MDAKTHADRLVGKGLAAGSVCAGAILLILLGLTGCGTTSESSWAGAPASLAPPVANPTTAREFVDEGEFFLGQRGMETRAMASFRKAFTLELDKRTASEAYCGLGEAFRRTGTTDKARKSFEEACKVDPENPGAWTSLARLSFGEGTKEVPLNVARLRRSIEYANRGIRVDPMYASAYVWRGRAKQLLGEKRDAAADFLTALDLGLSEYATVLVREQLANAWFDAGEYDPAIEQWRILLGMKGMDERARKSWQRMIDVSKKAQEQSLKRG